MNATYKLHVVACHDDWTDTHERVAVQLIRECKAEADIPAELDRAATAILPTVRIFQGGSELNSTALRLAFACDILADEQRQTRNQWNGSYLFTRSIPVAGNSRRLKWASNPPGWDHV